ncbi:hypothetical protein N7522_004859 [Penicillium canescens]|uniref:Uncharacterized protein n=1 Tax=Penicillium canescens TaxID=5083 RepID=A0AAD6I0I4_PENCN|nr:uncharacterized protein N7446_004736 [Penicillium canescens]KAJ6009843.1 hypothetical protein N7522_004859 [Penicillium canescens]KAJ6026661.1 hypothetical protein N7460_011478 [Penicillium canescens]KAJ6067699.1 hypothetical protein N7446_004736 [Penicillium canescens]
MLLPRRAVLFLSACFFLILLLTARSLSRPWREVPQVIGLGDLLPSNNASGSGPGRWNITRGHTSNDLYAPPPNFIPGTPKPPGYKYTKTMVVARTKEEDTSWIAEELPDWQRAIYVADDPSAPLHPPKNKGHEVMIYLTYIVDHYDRLPDVAVFMHSHQVAWHNDNLFGGDAAELLRRLNLNRVIREGYMNTRCGYGPGCPAWMHPGAIEEDESKQEEIMLARAWGELFPDEAIPNVLAQPCCAQFALSRDRIRSIPHARYVYYRDWLLGTDLSDYITGRIWEYLWQYVFTGEAVLCVEETVCLCDGYGFCFGGDDEFREYQALEAKVTELQNDVGGWMWLADDLDFADDAVDLTSPAAGDDESLSQKIEGAENEIVERLQAAVERGKDPRNRALEAGRPWNEGDGF